VGAYPRSSLFVTRGRFISVQTCGKRQAVLCAREAIFRQPPKSPQAELWARLGRPIRYVEKNTCEFAVPAARIAGFPRTMGAGFAEIGFIFESLTSSSSTFRCSCGWGRLVRVMTPFSHAVRQRGRTHTAGLQGILCGNIETFRIPAGVVNACNRVSPITSPSKRSSTLKAVQRVGLPSMANATEIESWWG
jgi:hypothetical protein